MDDERLVAIGAVLVLLALIGTIFTWNVVVDLAREQTTQEAIKAGLEQQVVGDGYSRRTIWVRPENKERP